MSHAPIALFVYNRPDHTRRTVEALRNNELAASSDLVIFSDAPAAPDAADAVWEVRQYIRSISGFKTIRLVERAANYGLARSIIDGVTAVVSEYGRIIVLEDDMVTSRFFLQYMNDALEYYANDDQVVCVHGYSYPVKGLPETFFLRDTGCWGWGTWKRGWALFEPDGHKLLAEIKVRGIGKEFDYSGSMPYVAMLEDQVYGRNDSWAIRWYASAFLRGKLTLHPGRSLVENIGIDGSGRHGEKTDRFFGVDLAQSRITVGGIPLAESEYAHSQLTAYFMLVRGSILRRVFRGLRRAAVKTRMHLGDCSRALFFRR